MTKKKKELLKAYVKQRKMVGWGNTNDKEVLLIGILCMIPIIGQLTWLITLFIALEEREVRYIITEVE